MRGLLFTGGTRPDMKLASRHFGVWDAVYAADSGLTGVHEAGLDADFVVGDMDSLEDQDMLLSFDEHRIIRAPCDKDETDTELALALMRNNGIDEIVMVGGGGGRMDHFFALERLFSRENPPRVWIGSDTVAWLLDAAGTPSEIELTGLESESISIFPVGGGPHACHAEGLLWNVGTLDWDSGAYSLSNRAQNGTCRIVSRSGRFLVITPVEGGFTVV